ncbi:MAG TPA: protein kinase, partial [Gemmataceae bacterium]|nr:protein kinase [Gemmataceae bacterium]
DRATLERLLAPGSDSGELEQVAAHLEVCPQCGETVESLLASDRTAAVLRGAKIPADEAPVAQLIARIAVLHPSAHEATASGEATAGAAPPSLEESPPEIVPLAPPQLPDEIGRLGGYRIFKELGRGGMGVVFKAEDIKLKRVVALKVMLPRLAADAPARQRFLREAQAMAAVHHDHVATIYQVDEDRGVPFLAMEFLEGMPLDRWLRDGRKPTTAQLLRIGREIAEGLAAAHDRGLIHRDVKPGNIWLESTHQGRVKILDFGLARAGKDDVHLTRSGAIVGTPAYMAPEQAAGEPVDPRSDLFSLGCVLYRLCTGVPPFTGSNTMALLRSLALDEAKSVRQINPALPADLADLIMRLLEKDPARRPASAREVVQALSAEKQDVNRVKATPGDTLPVAAVIQKAVPASPQRRRRVGVLIGLMLAGAAVAAAAAIIIVIRDKDGNKVGEVTVPPGGKVEIIDDGKKGDPDVQPKAALDEAWIRQVAALPAGKQVEAVAAKLKERNPGFDGNVTPTIDNGLVVGLQFLTDKVTDVSPVRALHELHVLTIAGTRGANPQRGEGQLADLSPLGDMKLTDLDCSDTCVSDLSPLHGMNLTSLRCNHDPVADLSPLKGMELVELWIDFSPVSDLSPLKDLRLSLLHIESTPVADLSPLKDMRLTNLNCGYTQVHDLSPLKDMRLTDLVCWHTPVSNLSPLKDMKLMKLALDSTPVSDLSPLKDMKLTQLVCESTNVSDLSPLKGMPMTLLVVRGANVSDLSPLRGMPLKELWCDFKPERDAAVLRSIPTLETINGKPAKEFLQQTGPAAKPPVEDAWIKQVAALPAEKQVNAVLAKLQELNPGFDGKATPQIENGAVVRLNFLTDEVSDISPLRALPTLKALICRGSGIGKGQVSNLSPLKGMKLEQLDFAYNQTSDLSPLEGMPLESLSLLSTPVAELEPLQKNLRLQNLDLGGARVSDLSAMKGMRLSYLSCRDTAVTDLSPVKGMPLTSLDCRGTQVTDFSPLKGLPLVALSGDFKLERDAELLRSIKTLVQINERPPEEFWKQLDGKKADPKP